MSWDLSAQGWDDLGGSGGRHGPGGMLRMRADAVATCTIVCLSYADCKPACSLPVVGGPSAA